MSTQQITPDSTQIPPDPNPARKPLQGKYDGRKNNGKKALESKTGRKPDWAKHLTKNAAAYALKEIGLKERCLDFLNATKWVPNGKNEPPIEVPDRSLQWEVLTYLWDRLEGRPFVAVNPAESKAAAPHDPKLLVAIQSLVVNQAPKRKAKAQVIDPPQLTEGKA